MADVSHLISLGIGSPSGVGHFVRVGLSSEADGGPSHLITLGIGTPAGIGEFIRVGLGTDANAVTFLGISSTAQVNGPAIVALDVIVTSTQRPMIVPSIELLVEGSPDTWLDITDDVVVDPIRWSRGIFGSGPLDLLARPGTMTFSLDNTETNATGVPYLYSPGHGNCLAGFRHGAIVRLHLSDGVNERYVFRGRLRNIDPDPDLYGLQLTRCLANDWLSDFATYDAGQLALREDVRSDELLTDLINSLPTQPVNQNIDVGLDQYEFAFDDLGGDLPKATAVAQDIVQSERGFMYLRGDFTDGETLRVENRQARALALLVATLLPSNLLHQSNTISVPSNLELVFNDIEVLTVPRSVDTTLVALVQLTSPTEVGPNTTERVFVDYKDPTNESEYVGGKDMVQPVLTTDWTANDERDGSGVDLSGSATVTAVYWGSRCMIEITNAHPTSTMFIRGPGGADGMQCRGYGLYRYRPESSRYTNQNSVDLFGARQLASPLMMPYQGDRNIGQGVASLIGTLYGGLTKTPTQVTPDTFSDAASVAFGIVRDVGDLLSLTETATGVVDARVFIHALSQELGTDNLLRSTYVLAPGDVTDVFILDDVNNGILDTNVLAYA
jgi:hypothetical protein